MPTQMKWREACAPGSANHAQSLVCARQRPPQFPLRPYNPPQFPLHPYRYVRPHSDTYGILARHRSPAIPIAPLNLLPPHHCSGLVNAHGNSQPALQLLRTGLPRQDDHLDLIRAIAASLFGNRDSAVGHVVSKEKPDSLPEDCPRRQGNLFAVQTSAKSERLAGVEVLLNPSGRDLSNAGSFPRYPDAITATTDRNLLWPHPI